MENDFFIFMRDNIHWFWFAMVVLFTLIEALTLGLTTIWFALGALVLVFLSFFDIPFWYQVLIFLIISSLLLIFTRPFAVKKFKLGKVKTNADGLIGKTGIVTKSISKFDRGEVKIEGKIWSARTEDDTTLEKDAECLILRIEGVTLIVKKAL